MPPAIALTRGITGAGIRKTSATAVRPEPGRMNQRGIQNAGVAANESAYQESSISLPQRRLEEERRNQLLSEQLKQKRSTDIERGILGASIAYAEEESRQQMVAEALEEDAIRDREAQANILKKMVKMKAKKAVTGSISRSTSKFAIAIAWSSYCLQFSLALISLALWAIAAEIESSFFGKVIGLFTDSFSSIPKDAGAAVGGIAFLITFGTYLGFSLWYHMIGINPMDKATSTLTTIFLVACSLTPVLNLIPFLVIWVMYMGNKSLFSNE